MKPPFPKPAVRIFLATLLALVFTPLAAQEQFRPTVATRVDPAAGTVVFTLSVGDSHHITDLKNEFFSVELAADEAVSIAKVDFPAGVPYGDETVYRGDIPVTVHLAVKRPLTAPRELKFTVNFQICQERPSELCFAPDGIEVPVTLPADFAASVRSPQPATTSAPAQGGSPLERLAGVVRGGMGRPGLSFFLAVFAAGFLTSLTPCVYPVIPLIMGYVGGRTGGNRWKGFSLSLLFILGLAVVYSLLGVVAAATGSMMGVSFQNPWMVGIIAAIFIVMGASMAGLFTIQPPAALAGKMGRGPKNQVLGAMVMGGISGIIAAPCVGPVLIAILSWISQTGNVFLGFWVTFVFSLGMSVIFLLAGTFSGAIASLPKGGRWMETIKHLFAVLLIGGGLLLLGTILPTWLDWVLWGVFLLTVAVFLNVFAPLEREAEASERLGRAVALVVLVLGAALLFQGIAQRFSPAPAAAKSAASSLIDWSGDLEGTLARAKADNRPVLIDTAADWCAACKELEERTFSRPAVAEALRPFLTVRLDFTRQSPEVDAQKKRFAVLGMPTVIVLRPDGSERGRFVGFKTEAEFLGFLQSLP